MPPPPLYEERKSGTYTLTYYFDVSRRACSAAPTITANFVIERKFVTRYVHKTRVRQGVEKSPSVQRDAVVRGNLIEIMHNACPLNIPDSSAVLTRNYFSRILPFGAPPPIGQNAKRNDSEMIVRGL